MSQYGYYEGMSLSVLYVERFSSITRVRVRKKGRETDEMRKRGEKDR